VHKIEQAPLSSRLVCRATGKRCPCGERAAAGAPHGGRCIFDRMIETTYPRRECPHWSGAGGAVSLIWSIVSYPQPEYIRASVSPVAALAAAEDRTRIGPMGRGHRNGPTPPGRPASRRPCGARGRAAWGRSGAPTSGGRPRRRSPAQEDQDENKFGLRNVTMSWAGAPLSSSRRLFVRLGAGCMLCLGVKRFARQRVRVRFLLASLSLAIVSRADLEHPWTSVSMLAHRAHMRKHDTQNKLDAKTRRADSDKNCGHLAAARRRPNVPAADNCARPVRAADCPAAS
jgi:hypothetical protein